jgi:hypothetical protein
MVTTFDKAIVAVLSGLFFFLGQFFGIGFFADMSPETFTAIAGAVTTVLVWLVPNAAPPAA